MTGPASLVRAEDGTLRLQGAVTFHSTLALYLECERLLVPGIKCLDCQGVEESDSSAVSLLLACRRLAGSRSVDISITGMGEQLRSLARLYGVEQLLID